jgi:hypothetical protein
MKGKTAFVLVLLVLVIIMSGCIGPAETPTAEPTGGQCLAPKKMIGDICCYDENDNGVCDMDDVGCPDSCDDGNECTNDTCSGSTDFKCVHEMIYPCCGNGVCDESEKLYNECPEDCDVLDISDFDLSDEKAYMVGNKFQFIHTVSTDPMKYFYLNITADDEVMQDVRYTFECNSSQNDDIDSIDSETTELEDEDDQKVNMYDDSNYLIYTNFKVKGTGEYVRDVEEILVGDTVFFNFRIEKKNPQKRDELECLIKLYFINPQRVIHKPLYISYI